jgi:hypothetical protein
MRLWIDGGSLHATGRCLKRTGSREDALHQLHLATNIAFADQLVIGAFEGGVYQQRSEEVQKTLIGLGYEQNCIVVHKSATSDLHSIYASAGDNLAADLEFLVNPSDSSEPADLFETSPPQWRDMERLFDECLRKDYSADELTNLFEQNEHVENNALIIMFVKSDAFRKVARGLVGTVKAWTPKHSAKVATVCRMFIHEECARRAEAAYAPGKDRGKLMRKTPEALLDGIKDLPATVYSEIFKLSNTGLPAVTAVLARRAKGSPEGLMSEALEIRQKAKSLRKHLDKILRKTAAGNVDPDVHLVREMSQLTADLRLYLQVKPPDSVFEAMDIFNMNGLIWNLLSSMRGINATKLVSVFMSLRRSRRIAVLGELTADAAVGGIDPTALAALQRGVMPIE